MMKIKLILKFSLVYFFFLTQQRENWRESPLYKYRTTFSFIRQVVADEKKEKKSSLVVYRSNSLV